MTEPDKQPLIGVDKSWTPEIVRDHLTALIIANDKRYEDKFAASDKAVLSALAAQEKAVNAALAASEKAVLVAENNAEKWRANANEWRGAMGDRERNFAQKSDLDALKERMDRDMGEKKGDDKHTENSRANIAIVVAAIVLLFQAAAYFKGHDTVQVVSPPPQPAPR